MEATATIKPWRPDLTQVRLDDLPPAYADVAEVIGLPAALTLVNLRGGSKLLVPVRERAEHPVAKALGPAAWAALRHACGGSRIDVPTLRVACMAARDRAIRRDHHQGAAVPLLARRFDLAERRIQEILAGDRP